MDKLFLRGSLIASIAFSALIHSSSAMSVDKNFRLLGLAMHQETGRDIYLGAIHLTSDAPIPANVSQSRAPKMMEYRVVARRTSIRSLVGKILLQSQVANDTSPSAETIEFADKLLSAVKGSLYAGDSLEIKQNSLGQLVALLNGTQLTSAEDSGIFNYLLNGWIRENGPSTAFRSSILEQDIRKKIYSDYEAITPSADRLAIISSWFDKESDASELLADTPADVTADDVAVTNEAESTSPVTAAIEPNPATAPGSMELADSETGDVSVLPDTKQAETLIAKLDTTFAGPVANQTVTFEQDRPTFFEPSTSSFKGSIVETSAARSLDSSFEATDVWTFENKARLAPLALPNLAQNEPFDILSLDVTEYSYRLANFNNALIRLVYSKIRYPRRAVRRSIEGALELDVTVLQDGSLVEVAIVESSGYSILDDAAVAAAQQALEETSLGEVDPVAVSEYGINGRLVVPVPVNFVLQD